ncbi:hypothetical protein S40288_04307 [Stachybotrys chartarum IBT 40288]|nr:hypothetical protein S40288_04307 [Stachybotrys chartarum IBT 40288]
MLWSRLEAVVAVGLQALAVSAHVAARAPSQMTEGIINPRELEQRLSPFARIYTTGTTGYDRASVRWSALEAPRAGIIVSVGTEGDVATVVRYANSRNVPFLATNGGHGSLTTLGRFDGGIEIRLDQLNGVDIANDGRTARIGGGALTKRIVDKLWEAGKETVTGACECVSLLGPGLGGGHGWLQGHHGLISDQFLSMNVVLADGGERVINADSELWWAFKGAGHNFGIVTSVVQRIYPLEHRDWAVETFAFSGDKVKEVYEAANRYLVRDGRRNVDIIDWSYWLHDNTLDSEKPVIILYLIQEGHVVNQAYSQPFHNIGPLVVTPLRGSYQNLAKWTLVSEDSPACQKTGASNPRFPIYLQNYNPEALEKAYNYFASTTGPQTPFKDSMFIFEGYSHQGVRDVDVRSTAFAFRYENILSAPLITYQPAGPSRDEEAAYIGKELRRILHEGSGRENLHAYVNYAYGSESPAELYGEESWRQSHLRDLKNKFDHMGRFSFYAPIA